MRAATRTCLLLLTSACLLLPACRGPQPASASSGENNTVRLAIQTWTGYAFASIGVEKGFFEGLKIEQTLMDDGNTRFPAFQSGAFDVLMEATTNITFEHEKGMIGRGQVIGITDESRGADGMLVRPDITSVAQLKGRRVAYVRTTTGQIILYRALQDAGLSIRDVISVPLDDPSTSGQAILSGKVDAALTWEPFLTQAQNSGKAKIFVTSRNYPHLVMDVMVGHENFLQRPDVVKKFLRGYLRSAAYYRDHPDECYPIIAHTLKMKSEEVAAIHHTFTPGDAKLNREYFLGPGRVLEKSIDYSGAVYLREGLISKAEPARSLISPLIREVVQEH